MREEPQLLPRPRFSKRRLALAFAIAALSDGLSLFLTLIPPVEWAVDLVTAVLLFIVLGRQWILLPGLILEAIPGLYVFPFWVLVVGAVAIWGRRGQKPTGPFGREGRDDARSSSIASGELKRTLSFSS